MAIDEMKKLTDITWPLIHDAALHEIEQFVLSSPLKG